MTEQGTQGTYREYRGYEIKVTRDNLTRVTILEDGIVCERLITHRSEADNLVLAEQLVDLIITEVEQGEEIAALRDDLQATKLAQLAIRTEFAKRNPK